MAPRKPRPWTKDSPPMALARPLLDGLPFPIVLMTVQGGLLHANPAAAALLGAGGHEALARESPIVYLPPGSDRRQAYRVRYADLPAPDGGVVARGAVLAGADQAVEATRLNAELARMGWRARHPGGEREATERAPAVPVPPARGCLTGRQREVVKALDTSGKIEAVAVQLCITPRTVRRHLREILRRLDIQTLEELWAFKE